MQAMRSNGHTGHLELDSAKLCSTWWVATQPLGTLPVARLEALTVETIYLTPAYVFTLHLGPVPA